VREDGRAQRQADHRGDRREPHEVAEGETLAVETSDGAGGCTTDTVVQVFGAVRPDPLPASRGCDDEPAALACDDDGGAPPCSLAFYTASTDGPVHVRVLGWHEAQGSYVADFTILAPFCECDLSFDCDPDAWDWGAPCACDPEC
jgi:hypothetical protein